VSTAIPQEQDDHRNDDENDHGNDVASGSRATSAERAQAQAVHELSEPERLDGSTGPVEPEG
jgi:hypothetical protein